MTGLHYATVRRLMKDAGAKRVSREAVEELMKLMEAYATKISSTAATIAENSGGRTTVLKEDIKVSAEEIHGVIGV